jgi:hypothetical protein
MDWNDLYYHNNLQILGLPRSATVHLYNNLGAIGLRRRRRLAGELFSPDRGFYVIDPIHTDQQRWTIDTFNIDKEQWFQKKCELVLDKGVDDFFIKFFPTHLEEIKKSFHHLYERITSKPFLIIYRRNWCRQVASYIYSLHHNQWSWNEKKYNTEPFKFPEQAVYNLILKQYELLFEHIKMIPRKRIIQAEAIADWGDEKNVDAPIKIYDQDKWFLYQQTITNLDDILGLCEERLQSLKEKYNFQLNGKGNQEIVILP